MTSTSDRPDRRAPEGAQCAVHPDRGAHFTCPRCGSFACLFCWHDRLDRCDACLQRDPASAAPPIPWEQQELPSGKRYLGTLWSAFRPMRSAPAFARKGSGPAFSFFMRSAVPMAALGGIIPHTRTVLFGPALATQFVGEVSGTMLAADIIRAAAIQLGLLLVIALTLMLPYATLVRAYAPTRTETAMRVLLYRLWLPQGATLLLGLLAWMAPAQLTQTGLLMIIPLGAQILVMVAMGYTARLACGLGALMSMIVIVVPFVLLILVEGLLSMALSAALGVPGGG